LLSSTTGIGLGLGLGLGNGRLTSLYSESINPGNILNGIKKLAIRQQKEKKVARSATR